MGSINLPVISVKWHMSDSVVLPTRQAVCALLTQQDILVHFLQLLYREVHLVDGNLELLHVTCYSHHVSIHGAYLELVVAQTILHLSCICLAKEYLLYGLYVNFFAQLDELSIP